MIPDRKACCNRGFENNLFSQVRNVLFCDYVDFAETGDVITVGVLKSPEFDITCLCWIEILYLPDRRIVADVGEFSFADFAPIAPVAGDKKLIP